MTEARIAPYGSWKSPIRTDMITAETISLGRIVLDGGDTYWAEIRPSEEGRETIVKRTAHGETLDVTPAQFNVGTTIHEYGARSFAIANGVIYFSNVNDQRLYRHRLGEEPVPITREGDLRYAGAVVDLGRNRLICVLEDHTVSDAEPTHSLISVDANGRDEARVLVSGNDFYAYPRLSRDGASLAWLTWNHPNMPWDGTELWVAAVAEDGTLGNKVLVAGGVDETVIQPEWSPNGTLYFVSDRTGWANLYRWRDDQVESVLEVEAEFAKTHWWLGMSAYGFESDSSIVCSYVKNGIWQMGRINTDSRELETIVTPYSELGKGDLKVAPGRVVFGGGSPVKPMSVLELAFDSGDLTVFQVSSESNIEPGYLSRPEAVSFPTDGEEMAYAFYYPPKNMDFRASAWEKPPLLVTCHGGPHDAASTALDLTYQYWTSRGFGVLDVNYGGSTGYGRAYRERLIGEWGIVDVNDCVYAAMYLVERGDVEWSRVAISGGSAGGFTALAAMTFRDTFKAGASHFGVSDLEALLTDIHKFDTNSMVGLIGPYPLYRRRYMERSPINHADRLSCPVIFFQGLDDPIVPVGQSELMFETVREKGIPTAYIAFEGEAHGFRKSENKQRALDAELYFYSRIFGFDLAEPVEPVHIENE